MREIPKSFIEYEIELKESLCLEKTFDCGQCFRWTKSEADGFFEGIADGRVLLARAENSVLTVYSSGDIDIRRAEAYFDLATDYGNFTREMLLRGGKPLSEAYRSACGIRILKQDFYETLISFIISQNNNIPRIKGCIENICRTYGKLICEADGKDYYAFPEPEVLANADPDEVQRICRVGYRAPFITAASKQFLSGAVTLSDIDKITPAEAVKRICGYKGVGNKVANCILLFAGLRRDAFPVDVWVERMLISLYGLEGLSRAQMEVWGRETFGEFAGAAQQFLFYYIREREEQNGSKT